MSGNPSAEYHSHQHHEGQCRHACGGTIDGKEVRLLNGDDTKGDQGTGGTEAGIPDSGPDAATGGTVGTGGNGSGGEASGGTDGSGGDGSGGTD